MKTTTAPFRSLCLAILLILALSGQTAPPSRQGVIAFRPIDEFGSTLIGWRIQQLGLRGGAQFDHPKSGLKTTKLAFGDYSFALIGPAQKRPNGEAFEPMVRGRVALDRQRQLVIAVVHPDVLRGMTADAIVKHFVLTGHVVGLPSSYQATLWARITPLVREFQPPID